MWLLSKLKIRFKMYSARSGGSLGGSSCTSCSRFMLIAFILYAVLFGDAFADNDVTRHAANDINQPGDDDLVWTNINKEIDMALKMIWPVMVQKGYTSIKLPDRTETISMKPLFITYTTRLQLTNGLLYNMVGISRTGDALMTYHNKSFQFRLNLAVKNVEFVYDYNLNFMPLDLYGAVDGAVQNAIITGDFSISVVDSNIRLNNFQIVTLGNIDIRLKFNSILRQLSAAILNPITDLFRDRIVALISDAVRKRLEELIEDINKNDRLHFKEFGRITLAGLTG